MAREEVLHARRGPPVPPLRDAHRRALPPAWACWPPLAIAVAAACLLASCLPFSAGALSTSDLSTLEMDPSKFMRIAPRDDVPVGTAEIRAGAAAARTRWYVLEYREHDNRKGFVPAGESEYVNLFLVSEVERGGEPAGVVRSRYLVAEIWRYYPAHGAKTCHQWTIWEDDPRSVPTRAAFRLLVESLDNVLLQDRRAPLDPPTLQRLGDFYVKMQRFLARRVQEPSGNTARRA